MAVRGPLKDWPSMLETLRDAFVEQARPSPDLLRTHALRLVPQRDWAATRAALSTFESIVRPQRCPRRRVTWIPRVACPELILPRAVQEGKTLEAAY